MKKARLIQVGPAEAAVVLDLVGRLMTELGEEGDETGELDVQEMTGT